MKRKILIIVSACALLLGIIIIVFAGTGGKKPFKDLKPSEIVSAAVCLMPPDKTIQITDVKELAACLNEVVIYDEDNSYTEYVGQAAAFSLILADGTQTEIMECNPFLVIDGVGYKTKYEPCEKLNAYANRLITEFPE